MKNNRLYQRYEVVVFRKTTEAFGGLSNMAGGYPLVVNGIEIKTSEALYQACRFPHLPDVQAMIIAEASPMTAKMKSKPFRSQSRHDWEQVKTTVMRWCLRVKLAQHYEKFSQLLLATEDKPIVEESNKDSYWGAKPINDQLIGQNILGRLLMELRETLKNTQNPLLPIAPPTLKNFLLLSQPVEMVYNTQKEPASKSNTSLPEQGSLF